MILIYRIYDNRACTILRKRVKLDGMHAVEMLQRIKEQMKCDPKPNVPYHDLGIIIESIERPAFELSERKP